MNNFVTRSSQASQAAQRTAFEPYHYAASRRLAAAGQFDSQGSSSASQSFCSTLANTDKEDFSSLPTISHEYTASATGPRFDIDWERLYHNKRRLMSARVGYRVKNKSQLLGKRRLASIWQYGVELEYLGDNIISKSVFFLCRECHLRKIASCCFLVNGTRHIKEHLKKAHKIDPDTGLMPAPITQLPASPFKAAAVVGSQQCFGQSLWQEEQLLTSLVDWVIVEDLSYALAVQPSTRRLITWNRSQLLRARPTSAVSMSQYVLTSLEERKQEIVLLLRGSISKISVSCDIWTSPNNVDFPGIVAHFVDK